MTTEICLQVTNNLFDELRVWQRYKPSEETYLEADWFQERLNSRLPLDSGVFPFDLRWISENGLGAIFEVPAGRRVITFTNANQYVAGQGERPVHDIMVWVPRTAIGVILDRSSWSPVTIWTFIITEPLSDNDQRLYACPLPNLYNDSHVCLPSSDRRFDQESFSHGLYAAYEAVWDTRYNTDLVDLIQQVGQSQRPKAIWNEMQKTYDLRMKTLIEKKLASPHRFRGRPSATPFQIIQAWGRLSPEEVEAIDDWYATDWTLGSLISTINRFTSMTPSTFSLFSAIRDSIGL